MHQSHFQITDISAPHPSGWIPIATTPIEDGHVYEINDWLRMMTRSRYDIAAMSRPYQRLIVFFEATSDAVLFKLAWGGTA